MLILWASARTANAQCLENLRRARTVYDEGRLHEIYDVLKNCLKGNDLNKEEKTEAYRLIILSYIFQDQPDLADQAMLDLLKANPLFETDNDTDPNELINLYRTFRTDPIYRIGLKGGGNYSLVNVINTYGTSPSGESNGVFNSSFSIGGALFIERDFFLNKIALRAEVSYSIYKTNFVGDYFKYEINSETTFIHRDDIETQNWIGFNFLGRYEFLKNSKIRPYAIVGPSFQSLLSSFSANNTNNDESESASGTPLDFKDTDIREKINLSAIVGAGVLIPLGTFSIIAEANYQYGFLDITNKHNASELTWKYGAGMSDISISTINFNIGVMFNKYSPKKLTN